MKGRAPRESDLHQSVAALLDWLLLPPALFTTFPAGWGVLTPMMAQRLKKSGLKQGMPDLLVFHQGRTLGIELKAGNNAATPAQRDMHTKLRDAGVPVFVCRTLEEVVTTLRLEDIPLRPTGDSLACQSLPLKHGGSNERAYSRS